MRPLLPDRLVWTPCYRQSGVCTWGYIRLDVEAWFSSTFDFSLFYHPFYPRSFTLRSFRSYKPLISMRFSLPFIIASLLVSTVVSVNTPILNGSRTDLGRGSFESTLDPLGMSLAGS